MLSACRVVPVGIRQAPDSPYGDIVAGMTAQLHTMPTPLARSLGATVRALMARHGIRQAQLAQLLDVPQSAISRRLSGRTPFDVNEVDLVARFFRVSAAELIDDAERPRPDDPDRGLLVRQEGLEPPTRWLTARPALELIRTAA